MARHCHMLTADMSCSENYEVVFKIGKAPNFSINESQSIRDCCSRCIEIETHFDRHIVTSGNDIHPLRARLADLTVQGDGGYELKELSVLVYPML